LKSFILFLLPLMFVQFALAEDIIFREGTFWQYRVSEEESNGPNFEVTSSYDYTVVVAKVGTPSSFKDTGVKFSKTIVKIASVNVYNENSEIIDGGFFALEGDDSIWMFNTYGYGWMVYKSGLASGYTWKAEMQEDVVSKFICSGYEDVKTKAGTFKNVMKIDSALEGDEEGRITYWVAKDIGMVKSVSTNGYNREITELVKYGKR